MWLKPKKILLEIAIKGYIASVLSLLLMVTIIPEAERTREDSAYRILENTRERSIAHLAVVVLPSIPAVALHCK